MICRNSGIENDICVAGADLVREFAIQDENGVAQNLTGASGTWKIAPVRAMAAGSNSAAFTAALTLGVEPGMQYPTKLVLDASGSELSGLCGLYVQQVTVTDSLDGVSKYQGHIQFNPSIA